jgi:YesN/AraC family two-component response regulator
MIKFNDINLHFSNMGLFKTTSDWIHPTRIIDSYEIIYVLSGSFDIMENNVSYHLEPNSLLFLDPHIQHRGVKMSTQPINFFWVHFYCDNFHSLGLKKIYSNQALKNEMYIFRELMSAQQEKQSLLCDLKLAELLLRLTTLSAQPKQIVCEIMEYIRVNSSENLSASKTSQYFGFTPEYCNKLFKDSLGITLSSYINKHKVRYIKSLLLNTTLSIKEIAVSCSFEDQNLFVKFFKYQTGVSPTEYRNTHIGIHLNNH